MTDVVEAAWELQLFCDRQGWRSCIIGGLAAIRWGEPRATRDVDISLLTGLGAEADYVDKLLQRFSPRVTSARELALQSRIVLLRAANGIGLDVALAAFPFEEECIARASLYEFDTVRPLRTASAEDLIVMKSLAGRGTDWQDVEGILARQAGALDWRYLLNQLASLAELFPDGDPVPRLTQLREEIEQRLDRHP